MLVNSPRAKLKRKHELMVLDGGESGYMTFECSPAQDSETEYYWKFFWEDPYRALGQRGKYKNTSLRLSLKRAAISP